MSEREKLESEEPGTDVEEDVEAHKRKAAMASDEPRTEGESDDDVEAHRKVKPL